MVWNVRLAEHSGLEFWLNPISIHAPLSPIFLIGTHIDEVNTTPKSATTSNPNTTPKAVTTSLKPKTTSPKVVTTTGAS